MRETALGCKILELNDAANLPLESANNEILEAAIKERVEKVEGKGLSTNDYTTTEKNKLAGIDSGANKYVHPATHAPSIIVQDANNRFVTDVEKSNWNSAAGKGIPYAPASGTNTYTASVAGLSSLTEGLSVKIKILNANTGASTLNINSLGAKAIKKSNGSELSSGNIKAGQICHLVYTGSNFQLLGEGGEYGTAQAGDVLAGKTIGTEAGLVEGTIPSKNAETITPGTSNKIIDAGQYLSGNQTIKGDPNLVSSNIKANASIFNVQGDSNVVNTADSNATAAQIRSGYTAYVKGSKLTGTIPNKTSESFYPGTSNKVINSGQYLSGNQTILGDAHLIPANIKDGVNIFGVVGTHKDFPITDFTNISPTGGSNSPNFIYYGNNRWVLQLGTVLYWRYYHSYSWTSINTTPFNTGAQALCMIYEKGLWIMGNVDGIYTSSDQMLNWTLSKLTNKGIYGIAYGKDVFVAVGSDGIIYTSTNGTSWTERTSGVNDLLSGVIYNPWGSGYFIAYGMNGKMLYSTNGSNWDTISSSFGTSSIQDMAIGKHLNAQYLVAVGTEGKMAKTTSLDGLSGWTQVHTPLGELYTITSVCYGGDIFIMTAINSTLSSGTVMVTEDFSSFIYKDPGDVIFTCVNYGDGRFSIGGYYNNVWITPTQLWNFNY